MKDYYSILGVSHDANQKQIRKAYYDLAKQWHPDMVAAPKKKEAEEKFKQISEAYHVLTNARSQYNRGYVSDDVFKDLEKAWEEVYVHFSDIRNMFEDIKTQFDEMELKMTVFQRMFITIGGLTVSLPVIINFNAGDIIKYFIFLSIGILCYLIALGIELIIYKELKLKPGKEFYWITKMIKTTFRSEKGKTKNNTSYVQVKKDDLII